MQSLVADLRASRFTKIRERRCATRDYMRYIVNVLIVCSDHVGQDSEGLPVSLHGEEGDVPDNSTSNHFQSRFKSQKV